MNRYRKSIAFIESNGQPNNGYGAIGGSNNHYDGKYQLGKLGKMDAAMILGGCISWTWKT